MPKQNPTQIEFFLRGPKIHAGLSALLVEENAKISLRFNEFSRCIVAVLLVVVVRFPVAAAGAVNGQTPLLRLLLLLLPFIC